MEVATVERRKVRKPKKYIEKILRRVLPKNSKRK
jgi:hypothetical protein